MCGGLGGGYSLWSCMQPYKLIAQHAVALCEAKQYYNNYYNCNTRSTVLAYNPEMHVHNISIYC